MTTQMENFEVGVKCCWTGHKFFVGEQGMKCLTCGLVTKNQAWEEKRQCFRKHTNSIPAIARNPNQSSPSIRRQPLVWRDSLPIRQRSIRKLKWQDSKVNTWKYIAISAIALLLFFVIIFMLKK
jgi:hypothetical protein